MIRKGMKPGLGVRPQPGEMKVKKRMIGGRRIWVIIKHGVAKGMAVDHGHKSVGEVGPGSYPGEYAPHPNNPDNEVLKVFTDPKDEDKATFLIPETLPLQNVEFEVEENDETNTQHG
ncbi:hypothetical protein IPM19_01555 [bacterium]|nr:MAG: hypothetical protein IPM19_01555 [bacterium]